MIIDALLCTSCGATDRLFEELTVVVVDMDAPLPRASLALKMAAADVDLAMNEGTEADLEKEMIELDDVSGGGGLPIAALSDGCRLRWAEE